MPAGTPAATWRGFLLVVLCFGWASAVVAQTSLPSDAHTVPDSLEQRLMACTLCHGAQGRSTNEGYFPRIAGKPAGYLYNQLLHFKDGRRNNPGMTALLDHMGEGYLRDIANHFGGLDLPYPPPRPPEVGASLLERGRQLVRSGDAARDLPACETCHGPALTGRLPDVPGLLGLPRDYLVSQLGAWQTGLRKAFEPDCMAHVAKLLKQDEVHAVSAWLAAQPLPSDTHPAQAGAEPMPLRCGNGQHAAETKPAGKS